MTTNRRNNTFPNLPLIPKRFLCRMLNRLKYLMNREDPSTRVNSSEKKKERKKTIIFKLGLTLM